MTYLVKKRQQLDNLLELPKEKRPPDLMIWWGTPEDIEDWLDKVYSRKPKDDKIEFIIREEEIG